MPQEHSPVGGGRVRRPALQIATRAPPCTGEGVGLTLMRRRLAVPLSSLEGERDGLLRRVPAAVGASRPIARVPHTRPPGALCAGGRTETSDGPCVYV